MASMTIGNPACVLVTDGSRVIQTCGCAWDRLFRAQADLLISGQIEFDDSMLDRLQLSDRPTGCPSANQAARMIILAHDEPRHSDDERRTRLRELMGRG